jgi:hypothetical protein
MVILEELRLHLLLTQEIVAICFRKESSAIAVFGRLDYKNILNFKALDPHTILTMNPSRSQSLALYLREYSWPHAFNEIG